MSRVIKFRAWNKKNKLMVDDEYENKSGDNLFLLMTLSGNLLGVDGDCWDGGANCYDSWKEGNPFIIDQFTGLHDANGKEIYCGDILTGQYNDLKFPVTVDYTHGIRFMFGRDQLCKANGAYNTIIGNIHENPELLNFS